MNDLSKRGSVQKIRVLHTVDWFGYGGMEQGVLKLMNGLDRNYFESYLVAMRDVEPDIKPQLLDDVNIFAMKKNDGRDFSIISRLAEYLKNEKIDVVHSHNWGAWLYSYAAAKLAGCPIYIHGEHGRDTENVAEGFAKRVFKILLAMKSKQFTTVSEDIAQLLHTHLLVNRNKIKVIENGIDLDRFCVADKKAAKKAIGFQSEILIGAVIGSLRPVKDLPTLFEALAIVKKDYQNWSLAIVGGRLDDSDEEYVRFLKNKIADLNLDDNIRFLGPQKKVERYMQAFDIYVNSSVYEGMSNTILEAMGCGAAVVATNVGGTPRIVKNQQTGLLVKHKSPGDLSAALLRLFREPDYRKTLSGNGLDFVNKNHSQQRFIHQHEQLYKDLIASKQGAKQFSLRTNKRRSIENELGVE
jgi:glycosyltransferase involved in cell wall biosynthesis